MPLSRSLRSPWWVVVGSTLALTVSNGPVVLFTFGVFLKPVTSAFGWDRGTMSLAVVLSSTASALVGPIVGILIDRWGVRRVTLIAIVCFSLAGTLISQTPDSPLVFALLYALWGMFGGGHANLSYTKAVSGWFDRQRGLALGITMAGTGIGVAVMPQFASFAIGEFGWRGAYVAIGALVFVVSIPAVFLLVQEPQPQQGRAHATRPVSFAGRSVAEAFRSSEFWIIGTALLLAVVAMNGTIAHVVPLLTDRGMTREVAAMALSVVGLSTIAGRLMSGYLLDHFFGPYVAACFFVVSSFGVFLLASGAAMPAPILAVILMGLSLGAEVDLIGFLVSRYFGLRSFGQISGYLFAVFQLGSGIGPWIMGVSFDTLHSYTVALVGLGSSLVAASVLMSQLGHYVFPIGASQPAAEETAPVTPALGA
ncbi:MAG TPA: MFS transporter [Candidatus Binataceae bacterium]|nr:MFS transporter [Candidatus Binataceae bacterium]